MARHTQSSTPGNSFLGSTQLCNILLFLNLIVMISISNYSMFQQASYSAEVASGAAMVENIRGAAAVDNMQAPNFEMPTKHQGASRSTMEVVVNRPLPIVGNGQRDFYALAAQTNTDKVKGQTTLPKCMDNNEKCMDKDATNPFCRIFGHFYHTMYQRWLGPLSKDDAEPFQFLEVGYYHGDGFETYMNYLPRAEAHSMEISCLPPGERSEGKWPYGNFARKHPQYESLRAANRLHCGDAGHVEWLNEIWLTHMKRPDAPPLKVVIDDASHRADDMAQTVFFWLPRIQPGGFLVVEDTQPLHKANAFRTQFLPQMMVDLHFCGETPKNEDMAREKPCFPQLQRFFKAIHCEMHICVFERSDVAATELSLEESQLPPGALDASTCKSLQLK